MLFFFPFSKRIKYYYIVSSTPVGNRPLKKCHQSFPFPFTNSFNFYIPNIFLKYFLKTNLMVWCGTAYRKINGQTCHYTICKLDMFLYLSLSILTAHIACIFIRCIITASITTRTYNGCRTTTSITAAERTIYIQSGPRCCKQSLE